MNRIIIYEGNTSTIRCTVTDAEGNPKNLAGFTCTIYVKKNKRDANAKIQKDGSVNFNEITFLLSALDTTISPGTYHYEIRIVSISETFTIVFDEFKVLDSLAVA